MKSIFDFIGRTEAVEGLGAGAGQRKAQAPWSAPKSDSRGLTLELDNCRNPTILPCKISKASLLNIPLFYHLPISEYSDFTKN
ncbi:hypothetical protein AB5I83_22335 [Mesobacillus sp. LC4]